MLERQIEIQDKIDLEKATVKEIPPTNEKKSKTAQSTSTNEEIDNLVKEALC